MYSKFCTYCEECRHIVVLSNKGKCPSCDSVCMPYPALCLAGQLSLMHFTSIFSKHKVWVYQSFPRCLFEMSMGGWEDVMYKAVDCFFDEMPDYPPLARELPKIDLVEITLTYKKEQFVTLADPPYSSKLYQSTWYNPVPFDNLFSLCLSEPVFHYTKRITKQALHFYQLVPPIAQIQIWNRMWQACVEQGFYPMPDVEGLDTLMQAFANRASQLLSHKGEHPNQEENVYSPHTEKKNPRGLSTLEKYRLLKRK